MKTTIAILAVMFAAASAATAYGAPTSGMNLKIMGGEENDFFRVTVSSDGRLYEVESNVALTADNKICTSAEGPSTFLLFCKAPAIAGFEISGGGGEDRIELVRVPAPATLSGGSEADTLAGGAAGDKIVGNGGGDLIVGNGGGDELLGGEGNDRILGGAGVDRLRGAGGEDSLFGGGGGDALFGGVGSDRLNGGPGNDFMIGGPGTDVLVGGPGEDVESQ